MKIEIRSHGFAIKPVIRRHIERRLSIALSSFDRHIDETIVAVRDINGPRGGKDLQGQVIVRLRRGLPIVVRAQADSVHALVSQLAIAVRRAVKSRIRRRRTRWLRLFRRRQRPGAMAAPADALQPGEPTDDRARLAV
jgi:ribosome-associated translation inhibitor RaiA